MNAPQPPNKLAAEHPTQALDHALSTVNSVLLGKSHTVRLAMACLVARGHLLLEDLPGMGKTVLAHALAKTLGLSFNRVQFTNDLLPGDLTGAAIFVKDKGEFVFHPGPIFTQLLLADEINRASPKTQSALLEAMEERQVSSDGATRPLPAPFFVIATQNPVDQLSTNALPEAQLDRFLMRISLGYPDAEAELAVLRGEDRRDLLENLQPSLDSAGLLGLQQAARAIHASDALLAYIRALASTPATVPGWRTACRPAAPWPCSPPAAPGRCSKDATMSCRPTSSAFSRRSPCIAWAWATPATPKPPPPNCWRPCRCHDATDQPAQRQPITAFVAPVVAPVSGHPSDRGWPSRPSLRPTAAGFFWLLAVVALIATAINYGNNLIFAQAFLCSLSGCRAPGRAGSWCASSIGAPMCQAPYLPAKRSPSTAGCTTASRPPALSCRPPGSRARKAVSMRAARRSLPCSCRPRSAAK